MSRIHEDLPAKQFTQPSGIVTAEICSESGKLAIAGVCDCDPRGSCIRTEYFAEGTEPTEYCDHHILANICSASGMLAGSYCPESSITSGVYVIGGTVETEDAPYLLTPDYLSLTCPVHNASNSSYTGSYSFPTIPGISSTTTTVSPSADPTTTTDTPASP